MDDYLKEVRYEEKTNGFINSGHVSVIGRRGPGRKISGATVGFQWQNKPSVYTILTLKLNGTAKMDSPMKFYTVSGVTFDTAMPIAQYPVSGSAYVTGPVGSQMLKISLSGTLAIAQEFIDLGRVHITNHRGWGGFGSM